MLHQGLFTSRNILYVVCSWSANLRQPFIWLYFICSVLLVVEVWKQFIWTWHDWVQSHKILQLIETLNRLFSSVDITLSHHHQQYILSQLVLVKPTLSATYVTLFWQRSSYLIDFLSVQLQGQIKASLKSQNC